MSQFSTRDENAASSNNIANSVRQATANFLDAITGLVQQSVVSRSPNPPTANISASDPSTRSGVAAAFGTPTALH